jgi:hypothetical protein
VRFNATTIVFSLTGSAVAAVSYQADNSCYRNCAGGGRCDAGLCRCPVDKTGADCSIALVSPLMSRASSLYNSLLP